MQWLCETHPSRCPKGAKMPSGDPYYEVNLTLIKAAAKRFEVFTAQRVGKYVEIRIGDVRLGVPQVREPIPSGVITTSLSNITEDRAKQILAPLGSKVTWK